MIIINEYKHEAIRTNNAHATLKAMLLEHMADGEWFPDMNGEDITPENIDQALEGIIAENEGFDNILLIDREGPEGVAVAFSSAGRDKFVTPWPNRTVRGEVVNIYHTIGIPEGVVVKGQLE